MPFANPDERAIHFRKHGAKFGAATEEEYEAMADSFLFDSLIPPTRECFRPGRVDRLRFNEISRDFGVAAVEPPVIRTYYPVKQTTMARHGGTRGYFSFECGRTAL